MKQVFFVILSMFILIGCQKSKGNENKVPKPFFEIDVTIERYIGSTFSLKIDSIGNTVFRYAFYDEDKINCPNYRFLEYKLNQSELDTISKYISLIDLNKVETDFVDNCERSLHFDMIIRKQGKRYRYIYEGRMYSSSNENTQTMFRLVYYLYNQCCNKELNIEKKYSFESVGFEQRMYRFRQ